MYPELKTFFEDHELARQAAQSLKDGREIAITLISGDQKILYTFIKQKGSNVLREGAAQNSDMAFTIPEEAARELVSKKFDSVGQVGLHIFEKMLSNDPKQKIGVKIEAGFLGLMTGGYLGILTAGGSDVARFLATKGLGSMGKLKETISKLRG